MPQATARKSARASSAKSSRAYAQESSARATENVVNLSTSAMRDFLSNGAGEAQKAQEKAFEFSRESAQQFAKSADRATGAMYEAVATTRDSIEACMEGAHMAANMCKELSSECFEFGNEAFSECVEMSKDALACRTINDCFDLQNRMMKYFIDSAFAQSSRISNMCFEYAGEMAEPMNERFARASEQFTKAFTA